MYPSPSSCPFFISNRKRKHSTSTSTESYAPKRQRLERSASVARISFEDTLELGQVEAGPRPVLPPRAPSDPGSVELDQVSCDWLLLVT